MAKPKLSTKTPDDPVINALIEAHPDLIAHFNRRGKTNSHIAIIDLGVSEVKIKEGGEQQATIVIRQLELMQPGSDRDAAEKLFTRVYSQRTGEKSRPKPEEPQTELDMPVGDAIEGAGIDDSV